MQNKITGSKDRSLIEDWGYVLMCAKLVGDMRDVWQVSAWLGHYQQELFDNIIRITNEDKVRTSLSSGQQDYCLGLVP